MPINKTATLYQQLLAPLKRTDVLAHRNVGHCFVLYAGANSQNNDMEVLLAYVLDARFDFYWTMDAAWAIDRNFGLHYQQLRDDEEFLFTPLKAFTLRQRVQSLSEQSADFPRQLALDLTTPIQCDKTFYNLPFAMTYSHRKNGYRLQQYTWYHYFLSQLLCNYCFSIIWRCIPVFWYVLLSLESSLVYRSESFSFQFWRLQWACLLWLRLWITCWSITGINTLVSCFIFFNETLFWSCLSS